MPTKGFIDYFGSPPTFLTALANPCGDGLLHEAFDLQIRFNCPSYSPLFHVRQVVRQSVKTRKSYFTYVFDFVRHTMLKSRLASGYEQKK